MKKQTEPPLSRQSPFYRLIRDMYAPGGIDKCAKRSGVPYMRHIDEGLLVLQDMKASDTAMEAYCLHPIVQDDEALKNILNSEMRMAISWLPAFTWGVGTLPWIFAMEYRSVANEYLSPRNISSIDEIRLSPLEGVNQMLIADKVQNYKDFQIHHLGKHARSAELDQYFKNWLQRLGISDSRYKELVELMSSI